MSNHEAIQDVNVQLDADLQHQATELFAEMGLSLSAACAIFVRQSLLEGGMPFNYRVYGSVPPGDARPACPRDSADSSHGYATYC